MRYFAKPVSLSPIICAASGWEVQHREVPRMRTDTALLWCSNCKAALAILIPHSLSVTAKHQIAAHYQQQLWQAHSIPCRHRKEAEFLLCNSLSTSVENDSNLMRPVVPTLLTRMLPDDSSLELVEQWAPWPLFRQRWMKLYPLVLALDHALDAPEQLLMYGDGGDSLIGTLLARLVGLLSAIDVSSNWTDPLPSLDTLAETRAAETTAAMVLTGWDLRRADGSGEKDTVECVLCLSCQPLVRPSSVGDGSPEAKRRKTVTSQWNQPVAGHRYYCPWVCGFPCAGSDHQTTRPPLWQILADRLLAPRPSDDANAVTEIHKMLRAGVSSQRVKGSPRKEMTLRG